MTEKTVRRGRPKGDGIDDSSMLAAVADMMVANPRMKARAAMRAIEPKWQDKDIDRWQFKWRRRKESLLSEARARVEMDRCRRAKQEAIEATRLSGTDIVRLSARIPNIHSIGLKAYMQNSAAFRLQRQIEQSSVFQLSQRLREKVEGIAAVQQRALLIASPAIQKWEAQSRLLKARFPTLYL